MRKIVLLFGFILVMALTACGPKHQFVLLPDPDGTVGVITVSNPKGSQTLSKAYQTTGLDRPDEAPRKPTVMDPAKAETMFKEALAVAPPPPLVFIVYFKPGSTEFTAESLKNIPKIMAAIKERKSTEIDVSGHTDRVGSDEVNRTISLKRAQTVKAKLIEEGVNKAHIHISYHGEGNPIVETSDDVAEPLNRRVEISVR